MDSIRQPGRIQQFTVSEDPVRSILWGAANTPGIYAYQFPGGQLI